MKKLFFTLVILFQLQLMWAQVPRLMSYQGLLTDQNGALIPDGFHTIALKLYDDINAANPIYTESHNTNVVKGIFNINIGSVNVIPNSMNFDRAYFLGVSVDFGAEMNPRTAFTSSPYSLYSDKAKTAEALSPNATGVVQNVNGIQGNVVLQGAGSTTVTQNNNVITIQSSVANGVQNISNSDGTIDIQNGAGPNTIIGVRSNGINSSHIQNGSIQIQDLNTNSVNENMVMKFRNGSWNYLPAKVINPLPEFKIIGNSVTDDISIGLNTNGVNENNVPKYRNGQWQFLPALRLTAGSGIGFANINPGTDDVIINALDPSATNEIQNLSYNSNSKTLSISQGNSVDLSSLAGGGSSKWTLSGNDISNNNSGFVGIGTNTPDGKLHVVGKIVVENSGQKFNIAPRANGQIAFEANGGNGDNTVVIDDDTKSVNIGTDIVASGFKLNVVGKAKFNTGVFFGNTEGFTDGGAGIVQMNSSLKPDINDGRDLGLINTRFRHLFLGGSIYFGSAEYFTDGGNNTIETNSHFRPSTSNLRDLGTSATRWRNIYLDGNVNFGNSEYFKDGGSNTIETNSHFRPTTTNLRDLGTSATRWRNLYLDGNVYFGSAEYFRDGGSNAIETNSTFRPSSNNTRDLGTSSFRWRDVFCSRNAFNGSDIRMKRDVKPLNYGVNEVLKINTYSYFWKDSIMDDGVRNLGVIAQELAGIIPELVKKGEKAEDLMSVNYVGLIPILINAIKEQQMEIASLKVELAKVETSQLSSQELAQLRSLLEKSNVLTQK